MEEKKRALISNNDRENDRKTNNNGIERFKEKQGI